VGIAELEIKAPLIQTPLPLALKKIKPVLAISWSGNHPFKPIYMRSLFRLAVIFAAFSIIVFSAGCGTDTPGLPGGVTLPPVVTLNSGAGFVSFNQDQPLNTPMITVSVSGQDGDALLRDLRIQ
jgi:hypothetical protein